MALFAILISIVEVYRENFKKIVFHRNTDVHEQSSIQTTIF